MSLAQLSELILANTILLYLRRKVLRQTDEEILEIDAQIEDEQKGILPDPNVPTDENGNPIEDPNMMDPTNGYGC